MILKLINNIINTKDNLSLSLIMKTDDKIICLSNFPSILRSIEYIKKYDLSLNHIIDIYDLIITLKIVDQYLKKLNSEFNIIYEIDTNKVYDLNDMCKLHTEIADYYYKYDKLYN